MVQKYQLTLKQQYAIYYLNDKTTKIVLFLGVCVDCLGKIGKFVCIFIFNVLKLIIMGLGISLMVFCIEEKDREKSEMGIDVPVEDCYLRLHKFYNIDYISPDRDNPDKHCLVGSCGCEYLVNERYEVVNKMIDDVSVFKFN